MREFRKDNWRLIYTPPAPGAWNMAVDETLLEVAGRGESLPTLRLYGWQPPCLSLGYAQPVSDVELEALATHKWDLVRRPTGGRAILHADELTYSVIARDDEQRLLGGVLESYRTLAQALLQALFLLDIPAQPVEKPAASTTAIANSSTNGETNPVCFDVPSNYEITVAGKKLIGSAQARRLGGILQHGSLPIYGDLTRITQVLAFSDEAARQASAQKLLDHATTIETALDGQNVPDWKAAADAFAQAFQQVLNLEFILTELSDDERRRADELVSSKYAHPDWTRKK